MRAPFALVVAIVLIAQGAAASHWTLYGVPPGGEPLLAPGPGHTLEPDDAVMHAPGNPLDGRENKVHHDDKPIGAGDLFLDARVAQRIGYGAAGVDFYAAHFTDTLHGRPDLLFPGVLHVSAWYGYWNDFDGDGVIDDVHDSANHLRDEFKWEGLARGEPVEMRYYQIPYDTLAPFARNPHTRLTGLAMHDRTALADPEQSWTLQSGTLDGMRIVTYGGGFLDTFQTLVFAGAPRSIGHPVGFDIDDPDTLIDVDRYEAVTADVQNLYTATTNFRWETSDAAFATVNELRDEADATVAQILEGLPGADDPPGPDPEIIEFVDETGADAVRLVLTVALTAAFSPLSLSSMVQRELVPPYPREPNHPEDDYGGRALYGGVGDAQGSHNTYPGYAQEHGFYLDNTARARVCPGLRVLPETGIQVTQIRQCTPVDTFDPWGARMSDDTRTSGVLLSFSTFVVLWKDVNGDGYIGAVCDPANPEAFDAETNTCRNPGNHPHSRITPGAQGNLGTTAETLNICPQTDLRANVVRLTPVGGPWRDVVVLRDIDHAPSPILREEDLDVRNDDEPIELRFRDTCGSSSIDVADEIYLPAEVRQPGILVEVTATMARFQDHNLDIDIGPQTVRDVDYLPPWM